MSINELIMFRIAICGRKNTFFPLYINSKVYERKVKNKIFIANNLLKRFSLYIKISYKNTLKAIHNL